MIEVKKAHELDIVELTEDLPEYGLLKGAKGTVVEVFDKPEEAYMIEFLEDLGATSKIADWVKPSQIKNIDTIAREIYTRGMAHLQQGNYIEAAREIRQAAELIPSYVRGLHESFGQTLAPIEDWPRLIAAMHFVRLIDPNYEFAKNNLAIAYLNYGVQEANKGNYEDSIQLFQSALRIESPSDVESIIKENIATSHTVLGIQSYKKGDFPLTVKHLEAAYTFNPNERTRHDLGVAYFHMAMLCVSKGDLQRAITYYQWAEDAGLMLPEVLNNHACALADNGEVEEAILRLESAQALAPKDESIRSNLSKLLNAKTPVDFITEEIQEEFSPISPMNVVRLSAAA
ncbi:MAG TPA: tetratricopeptide repeat protein [Pyrinomonadaceae bacterium]